MVAEQGSEPLSLSNPSMGRAQLEKTQGSSLVWPWLGPEPPEASVGPRTPGPGRRRWGGPSKEDPGAVDRGGQNDALDWGRP